MATARKTLTQLDQLGAEFEPGEHQTRKQAGIELTYISIDATINRLNAVLGPNWSTSAATTLLPMPVYDDDGAVTGSTNQAVCELTLTAVIDGTEKHAYGVGAMVNRDPDMATKTALAEAIKKAGHQLGIGLYLWNDEARERVTKKRKLATGSFAALKQAVFELAIEQTGKPKEALKAKDIAAWFGVTPGDLADEDVLKGILKKEGLL